MAQQAAERVTLKDGAEVLVRPLERDDAALVQAVFDEMGEDNRYLRFLGYKKRLSARDLEALTGVDHHGHEAVVALDADTGAALGVARMIKEQARPEAAEVAVSVGDPWQGRGLGSILLQRLVQRAHEEGVERFTAVLVARNQAILHLFERIGTVRILSRHGDNLDIEVGLPVEAGVPHEVLRAAAATQS